MLSYWNLVRAVISGKEIKFVFMYAFVVYVYGHSILHFVINDYIPQMNSF